MTGPRRRKRKARCLWCGRTYALTNRGQVHRHARYLGTASRRQCLGSGQVPAMTPQRRGWDA